MSNKITTLLSCLLILLATITGLLLWNSLPASMASHWGANDVVNGYTSKTWAVFLVPLISLGMLLLFLIIPSIDPLKANIQKFRGTFNTMIVLIIAFMVYVHLLTLFWNLGYRSFKMSTAMLPALGLLYIFIGLLISKAKRNFFIGIRTPWTLSSDSVWDQTQRLGGILFIAAGLISFLGIFFPENPLWFILYPVIAASLIAVLYSYFIYQKEAKA